MKETLKLSIALGIICCLAASVLAYAEWKTLEPRRRAEAAQRQEALQLVLPAFANDPLAESVVVDGITLFMARAESGDLLAVAAEGSSNKGFGGTVSVLASFSPDGHILHVLVTDHKETPGLGTQVTDRRTKRSLWELFAQAQENSAAAGLPPNAFLDAYSGRPAAVVGAPEFTVVKSAEQVGDKAVLAISGATVSSQAVNDAISRVSAACSAYLKTL